MKETAHKLKSLTAFDISGDYLIGGLFIPSPMNALQATTKKPLSTLIQT